MKEKVNDMAISISGGYEESLGQWLFSIAGEVDISNAPQLKAELEKAYEQQAADIFLDVSEMNYIDSSGLGVIIGVLERIRDTGHRIVLVEPRENVKKLLRITSLDKVLC